MFDELPQHAGNPQELFAFVAQELANAGSWSRLFDLRLLQARFDLGLNLARRESFDDVQEPVRTQLENSYLAACREVGQLLLDAGRLREAWIYLRPVGDRSPVQRYLSRVSPPSDGDDASLDELIEVALFEGVDPERGYAWLLGKRGTCNSITTLDAMQSQLRRDDLRACAAILVRHVYGELRGNLRGHLHRLRGSAPENLSVRELIDQFPELVEGGSYHLDASHLGSAVRYARLLDDPRLLGVAREMVEYGGRLPKDLQYPDQAPFEETYVAHRLYFAALSGEGAVPALEYFERRAAESNFETDGAGPVETYVTLLARLGRARDALDAYGQFVPRGRELSPMAPTLLELAQAAGDWDAYAALCRERDDVVGFVAGTLANKAEPSSSR